MAPAPDATSIARAMEIAGASLTTPRCAPSTGALFSDSCEMTEKRNPVTVHTES